MQSRPKRAAFKGRSLRERVAEENRTTVTDNPL